MIAERWLPIPDIPGYEVSDLGRVRSQRGGTPHILRLFPNEKRGGYLQARVRMSGKRIYRNVHRLVLEAFVGPRPAGMVTRHLNGTPTDNRLVNLTYGTQSENCYDTVRHGRNPQAAATECSQGHEFSGDNVRVDARGRRRCRECERLRSLAYVARQRLRPKSELIHGKIRSYIAGCRCDLCKTARRDAARRERAAAQERLAS